jgi:HEAT repeat protein
MSERARWDPALRRLHQLGIQRNLKHLNKFVNATQQDNPQLRSLACSALGWLRDSTTIQPLISCLRDPVASVRLAALSSLMYTPKFEDSQLLCSLMNDDVDPRVRARSARAIGYLRLDGSEALRHALEHETERPVLTQIVYALGRLDCVVAGQAIYALRNTSDTALKIEVTRTLTRFKDPRFNAVQMLDSTEPLLRVEAIRSLAQNHIERLYGAVERLMSDNNPAVRCAVVISLRNSECPKAQSIFRALPADQHPEVSRHQDVRADSVHPDTKI